RLCDAMPAPSGVAYCTINVWEEVLPMRKLLVRSGLAGLIAASFLVGAPAAFAEMVMYKATLAAASEVPPTDSKGSGALTASYDTATKKLTYSATYKD